MALNITIVAALVLLVLLGFVGFRRDLRRSVLALVGTLLGAILVGFWAELWGQSLTQRFGGGNPQRLTFIVSCLIFLFSVLVVGYGGGVLFGPKERTPFPRRLASGLLGLLNGALIVGYLLRFGTASNPDFLETVQDILPARILYDGMPLLFLVFTFGVAMLVLVRAAALFRGRELGAPAKPSEMALPKPAPPPAAAAPSTPRVDERDILEKINRQV
jgi:hypothetical protein